MQEKLKELKRLVHELPKTPENLAILEDIYQKLRDTEFHEQQVLNLSFNKQFGMLGVMLYGMDEESGVLRPIKVDKQGRVILSK